MTTRRRFTGEFKARVALEALRGDKTVQEIAARHQVHPNQVSTWKRQAMDGLSEVFSNGADPSPRHWTPPGPGPAPLPLTAWYDGRQKTPSCKRAPLRRQ